jgi:AcrR family transcriptional regulator
MKKGEIKLPNGKKTAHGSAMKEKAARAAGEHAGMTREKIYMGAITLWEAQKEADFSLQELATALNVSRATIRFHFKGGASEILDEISQSFFEGLTPPFSLSAEPTDYLRKVFETALKYFRKSPSLCRQAIVRLTDRPLLSPIFAERICATVAAIAEDQDSAYGLELVINRLAGLILIETGVWALAKPAAVEAEIKTAISKLPPTEFPTLKKHAASLAGSYNKRANAAYFDKLAFDTVDEIVSQLKSSAIAKTKTSIAK